MMKPLEEGEQVERRIREGDKVPALLMVLGSRGKEKKGETYLSMTGDEIKKIIAGNDQLPENQAGGKKFLIHRTAQGTIALTEVEDGEREGEGRARRGRRILELERTSAGGLHKISGTQPEDPGPFPMFFWTKKNQHFSYK